MTKTSDNGKNWYRKQRDELFIAIQRLLPQHTASRLLGKIAESKIPWLKNGLIRLATRHYKIDLSEAEFDDATAYPSFNRFFTRKLKPATRPIDSAPLSLVSPADGSISQIGKISDEGIIQAKGRNFSTHALLGSSPEEAISFSRGSFATVYLSPRDYHRVHMPVDGKLLETRYIPGRLFSVNDTTTEHIDNLFARNERLVCQFQTDFGHMAVVLVGALFVAGIESSWQKVYSPEKLQIQSFPSPRTFNKGDELGAFRFGSTVIVVTEKEVKWQDHLSNGSACQMGKALGYFS